MKIQNSDLSENRFGNQIFQFYFLKLIEKHLGLRATCHHWTGDQLFELDYSDACDNPERVEDLEPRISRMDSYTNELDFIKGICQDSSGVLDIRGYFQYHTWHFRNVKLLFLKTFEFRQLIQRQVQEALGRLKLEHTFTVGLHMRAGDYRELTAFHPLFWMPSLESYLRAIRNLRDSHLRDYVIYLASDEVDYFKPLLNDEGLSVLSSANLFGDLTPAQALIVDYFMLAHSDAMVISNSSFSFSAAMLNQRARVFMRPGMRSDDFIPFDPWNSQVLIPRTFGLVAEGQCGT